MDWTRLVYKRRYTDCRCPQPPPAPPLRYEKINLIRTRHVEEFRIRDFVHTAGASRVENTQSQLEERQWAESASKNYLWADIVWQMFDATSPGKNEGDTSGVNDKGLVTRDRSTKKDTYYFYQANWNNPARTWANQKVLYISDHNWTDRQGRKSPCQRQSPSIPTWRADTFAEWLLAGNDVPDCDQRRDDSGYLFDDGELGFRRQCHPS